MLTDSDLACPTCGAPRETGGVTPPPEPSTQTGRPISEVLDLMSVPTTNGNGSTSSWEDHATYPTTVEQPTNTVSTWDQLEETFEEADEPAPWNGQAVAPETWTPPTISSPAPSPTWTPPPAVETRPLALTDPPPRFTPAPAPPRVAAPVAARTTVRTVTEADEESERFALLGGLDPRKLGRMTRRARFTILGVVTAIVVTIAVVFGLEQWQRALNAEHQLDATRNRVSTQSQTIEGLSERVLGLNAEIDETSNLLTRAQDQAAVSGKDLDKLSAAIGELSQARELMRAAVANISKMTKALEIKDFKEAGKFAEAASSQLEQAFVHEQRASEQLN